MCKVAPPLTEILPPHVASSLNSSVPSRTDNSPVAVAVAERRSVPLPVFVMFPEPEIGDTIETGLIWASGGSDTVFASISVSVPSTASIVRAKIETPARDSLPPAK